MQTTQPTSRITPGLVHEMRFEVLPEYTAAHMGSGSARVLSTPSMILFMERTAQRLLARRLPPEYTSVGTLVNVRHLAAAPLGAPVRVRASVEEVDGRRVLLLVEAWSGDKQLGAGQHERFVVHEARFLERLKNQT